MKSKVLYTAFCLVLVLCASFAQAQATRTWISGVGDDVNPCSRTAPCKTWAGAISKTASNGAINVLDPGAFGQLTITKPITIDGKAQMASTLNSTSGIVVNTPGASDTVIIRNMEIIGVPTAASTRGINVIACKNLIVEHVNIYKMQGSNPNGMGILIQSNIANSNVYLHDVSITANTDRGVLCQPVSPGTVRLSVEDSIISQNGSTAIDLVSNCKATVAHSWLEQNGGTGLLAEAASTDANIADSYINFNSFGVSAVATTVWIFGTQISHNTVSVNPVSGATIISHANNAILNNNTNTLPTTAGGGQQ